MNSYLRNLEARQAIRNRIARQRRRLDRQLGRVSDSVLLFGSLRFATGSIWPAVAAHACANVWWRGAALY